MVTYAKISPKNGEPQRYSWGMRTHTHTHTHTHKNILLVNVGSRLTVLSVNMLQSKLQFLMFLRLWCHRHTYWTSPAGTGSAVMTLCVWRNSSWASSLRAVWLQASPPSWPISSPWGPTNLWVDDWVCFIIMSSSSSLCSGIFSWSWNITTWMVIKWSNVQKSYSVVTPRTVDGKQKEKCGKVYACV